MKRKPKESAPIPSYTITNCTFTQGPNAASVETMKIVAEALLCLAKGISGVGGAPCISIGNGEAK